MMAPFHGGGRRGREARQRTGVTVAVRVKGSHHQRAGAALGGAHDAVPARRQALGGGQVVRQLAGQEGLPLAAAVLLLAGVSEI